MRRRELLWIASLLAVGCAHEPTTESSASNTSTTETPAQISPPRDLKASDLSIPHAGSHVRVGDTWDSVLAIFPEPKTAFAFKDLPPQFGPGYAADGWETAGEGVGVVLYNLKVAAFMRQINHANQSLYSNLLDLIDQENPNSKPKSVAGKHVRYWFWQSGSQRIMLCALQSKSSGLRITESLGDDTVMDALGINPDLAARDVAEVDRIYEQPATSS
jgi:hypothetical protein